MEDNVDYRLLEHWKAQRRPALYAAAANARPSEFEEKLTRASIGSTSAAARPSRKSTGCPGA